MSQSANKSRVPLRIKCARVALAVCAMLTLPLTIAELIKIVPPPMPDFGVYLTAAHMVRAGDSKDIYDGADLGTNPALRFSPVGSPFQREAAAIGHLNTTMYIYPPALADALVPLTFLSLQAAKTTWLVLNLLLLAACALLFCRLFGWRPGRAASFCALATVFLFRPNASSFYWGQVTVLLLFLWTVGIVAIAFGAPRVSAVALALGTAIKLTPLIVVVPMLFWRQWRWVRWYALSLAACLTLMCVVNGAATVADFFLRVMPPMSAGFPSVMNPSFESGVGLIYASVKHLDTAIFFSLPPWIKFAGKLVSATAFLLVLAKLSRLGRPVTLLQKAQVLAIFALLSVCIAPVSWRPAYAVALPLLFFQWREALTRAVPFWRLALLTAATLEFSFVLDTALGKLPPSYSFLHATVPLFAPCFGVALALTTLREMAGGPHMGFDSTPRTKKNNPCPIYARVLCGHMWDAKKPRAPALDFIPGLPNSICTATDP